MKEMNSVSEATFCGAMKKNCIIVIKYIGLSSLRMSVSDN